MTRIRSKGDPNTLTFSVKPRLLTLLGDQLIRDATVAVFELVKNAYDADATVCNVTLEIADDEDGARIVIEDDGTGMSENILRTAWMVIGTDFRALQRVERERTRKFNRLPLGEKGLGRLSVHKLGRMIHLITREKHGRELEVHFDWDRLETAENLDTAVVRLRRRKPITFPGTEHGTRIEVTRLREEWTRGEVRRLHRAVNALRSPYEAPTDFQVSLSVPGHEVWLEDLFTAENAKRAAVYRVRGSFEGTTGRFTYVFKPPPAFRGQLTGRRSVVRDVLLQRKENRKPEALDLSDHDVGRVKFEFLMFDRDPQVLGASTDDVAGLKRYLDENGGIRIYRDGIRVYDFGEPGNDWLNLDARRVNTPTARTSNNQILGVLELDALESTGLREKTNREGFIESPAFADFRDAVLSVMTFVEAEKTKDQRRLREAFGKSTGQRVFAKLSELREALAQQGHLEEVEPMLRSVETEMEMYRDQLLHAAVPGLTIGIMLHGAEKILEELRIAVRKDFDAARVRALIDRLYRSMRPVTNLLKNPGISTTSAVVLIKEALFSTELRLKRHGIDLTSPSDIDSRDFKVKGSKQMLVASITNLIDNSIHWLEAKNPRRKLIYVGITRDLDGGPAIVVADNGPGFGDDAPGDLVAPFFSRRNGGMGLGLYIVSEVMRVNNGRVIFPPSGDISLPEKINGAVVALQFPDHS
jgi:signal transduction histidine kinase